MRAYVTVHAFLLAGKAAAVGQHQNPAAAFFQQLPGGDITALTVIRFDHHKFFGIPGAVRDSVDKHSGDIGQLLVVAVVPAAYVDQPADILHFEHLEIFLLDLHILVGVADKRGIARCKQSGLQLMHQLHEKFVGDVRHDDTDVIHPVGTQPLGHHTGNIMVFPDDRLYLFLGLLGIPAVSVDDPGNRCNGNPRHCRNIFYRQILFQDSHPPLNKRCVIVYLIL